MTQLKRTQSIANRFLPRLVYRFRLVAILVVLFGSVCPAAIAQNQLNPNSNPLNLSQGQTTPVPKPTGVSPTPSKSDDPLLTIEKEKLKLEQEKVKLEREKIQLENQRFQIEQEQNQHKQFWGVAGILGTSTAIAGTLATIAGGLIVFRNYRVAVENRQIAEDKVLTERFSNAVELLGKEEQIQVRIGAVYALKKLAEDSPEDYEEVVADVLSGFVREMSRKNTVSQEESRTRKVTPTDIQAALKVINGLAKSMNESVAPDDEKYYIADLSKSNLEHAWLNDFELPKAWLWYTNLSDGYLANAKLHWARLWGANLTKADFTNAELRAAKLGDTLLEGAKFGGADLSHANLEQTKSWEGVILNESTNLRNTILLQANLAACETLTKDHLEGVVKDLEGKEPPFLCNTILPDSMEGYSFDDLQKLRNRDCTNPKFHQALANRRSSLGNDKNKAEEYIRTEVIGEEGYKILQQERIQSSNTAVSE